MFPGTKTGTRVLSPKPPFYETALLSPSDPHNNPRAAETQRTSGGRQLCTLVRGAWPLCPPLKVLVATSAMAGLQEAINNKNKTLTSSNGEPKSIHPLPPTPLKYPSRGEGRIREGGAYIKFPPRGGVRIIYISPGPPTPLPRKCLLAIRGGGGGGT